VTEVSSYERIAISYRGGKKGKKTGASRSRRYPDTHPVSIRPVIESGKRCNFTSRGADGSPSLPHLRADRGAARCGAMHACTHDGATGMPVTGAALNTRAYFRGRREKINSVVRAKSGTAFQHAVDAMRLRDPSHVLKRRAARKGVEDEGEERKQKSQAGRNFTYPIVSLPDVI